ncbi:MAG: alpha/beta hydrolase [Methylomonas sp.]|nr:alpha/beta hydrolase [Methylomonas sp.]PPD21955.1 MAG: alpha/beta hydrolase [Methylomonas sp.]PPD25737.1 MAG: alpha/beta hydrolase [Methylomonas sp.]PPD36990.1 MAG: alpha/beta hydrolase [Methylomonas sp.]PPD39119.1 MAG: alpha/beta hydrolase [Methylomonas sp.]
MTDTHPKNWLLLRGLGRQSAHWGQFPELLAQAFAPASVHTIDLPGTGIYHRETSPKTIPGIMTKTRARALEKGLLSQPTWLIGFSLGGMVAWEWLHRQPDDIAGVVLINTSLASISPFYKRLCWQNYPDVLRILLQGNVLQRETELLKLVSNLHRHSETVAQEWTSIQIARPMSLQNALHQMMAAARYRPELAAPTLPVLLLASREDRLVSSECSTKIAEQLNLPLMQHPSAGHDLTLDDSPWVLTSVKQWLNTRPY